MAFRKILVPFDDSHPANRALLVARRLAGRTGQIELVRAVPAPLTVGAPGPLGQAVREVEFGIDMEDLVAAKNALSAKAHELRSRGFLATGTAELGDPAAVILRHAPNAGLVVMGTHGRSLVLREFLGSVAQEVVAKTDGPVVLVPATMGDMPETGELRVLVPLDESDVDGLAIQAAAGVAETTAAFVTLFMVRIGVAPPQSQKTPAWYRSPTLDQSVQIFSSVRQLQEAGVKAEVALSVGNPAEEILDFLRREHFDLVVMASHKRKGLKRLVFGSVTEQVVRQARLPVLVA